MINNRKRAFIEHYLAHWNATAAARLAGYSEHTAYSQGARLLKDVEVQAAIAARLGELQATADEVKLRLTRHARGTMEDFLSETGLGLDIGRARARGQADLLKKYKTTTHRDAGGGETVIVEVELYDAQAALALMGRALGIFVDRQEITGKDGAPLTPISFIEPVTPPIAPAPEPESDESTGAGSPAERAGDA